MRYNKGVIQKSIKIFFIFLFLAILFLTGWPQIGKIPPLIKKTYAAIGYNTAIGTTGTGTNSSASLNHAAKTMIIIVVSYEGTTSPSSVTVAGSNATYMTSSKVSYSTTNSSEVWYYYASAAANDSIAVNFAAGTRHAWSAASYTGVKSASSFEGLATNNGSGASVQTSTVNISAGTANRWIIGAGGAMDNAAGSGSINSAAANSATKRDGQQLAGNGSRKSVSSEIQDYGSSGAYASTTTWTKAGRTINWAVSTVALLPIVAPTVTTQAASSVEATTATGNGNITATGGENATAWGVCYKITAGCTTSDSTAAGSGTGGTGAFTASLSSLSSGTTYYINAYATNTGGTSYGTETTFLTKPAAPTGVAATDGTLPDKVTITWTKSTGATGYRVYRDGSDISGLLGDVATYDDAGAGAPSITPGSAVASDGTSTAQVVLSISGSSTTDGPTYSYKVVASNATGNSSDSVANTGYRGIPSISYQWYRSAANSDTNFSQLSGATTSPYNDTTAPAPTITAGTISATDGTAIDYVTLSVSGQSANAGDGRYYYAVLSATGVASQNTTHNQGNIGVGALTYQWQRSAADSDASYSDIGGAISAPYNDTGAPADGSGRYFKLVENAQGATQQITSPDRGYRGILSINITSDGNISYGFVAAGAQKSTIDLSDTQTAQNTSTAPEDFNIQTTNATGGTQWTIGSFAGDKIFVYEFFPAGGSWTKFNAADSYQSFVTNVLAGASKNFDLRITLPTITGDFAQKSITVTVQAVAH
jgi:hypothetical protein